MRHVMMTVSVAGSLFFVAALPARGELACPNNPDALGTSRTIVVDPAALPLIGIMQYKTTLPLEDHEVVLTFDDGPLPPYTDRILDTLAAHCVKATYFLVGEMARAYPGQVRRIYNAGHVIGTHSQSHPLTFNVMAPARVDREVSRGIASVEAAVGDPRAVAPFFRIPGLARSKSVEAYLVSKSLAVWSADEAADDWHRGITPAEIVRRAIRRLEAHNHRGVLLLHDIQPATARALPMLLKELKARGYRIVHAVPPGEWPKQPVPEHETLIIAGKGSGSPLVLKTDETGAADAAPEDAAAKLKFVHRARWKKEHKMQLAAFKWRWPLFWPQTSSKSRRSPTRL